MNKQEKSWEEALYLFNFFLRIQEKELLNCLLKWIVSDSNLKTEYYD